MIVVLADHNLEGQAALLWSTMATSGWLDLAPFQLVTFADLNLPVTSSDREVWRFVQQHGMMLLTGNRNMDGEDSLEQVIREENYSTALPVLTISDVDWIIERQYREECADRLVEIGIALEQYRGTGRLYLP